MKKNRKDENLRVKGIRKPKFIVFTDKDGTLNLEDKQLSNILKLITSMGGMVVPITGRTVGDLKEDFEKRNLFMPSIIVGDNGANIYFTETDRFIRKTLKHEKVEKIIEKFNEIGGNPDLIRYTDGRNIYASKEKSVKEYYKNNEIAKLHSKIENKITNTENVTKITLAGSKKEMEQMAKIAESLGFSTDMDKTKFPEKEQENYRLDIVPKKISKGKAVETIVDCLKPEYGYICIGNGYNDISMFKQAIDDGMIAGVMEESNPDLIEMMKEYEKNSNKGKVLIVPKEKNKANRWIYRIAKLVQARINSDKYVGKKQKRKNRNQLPSVQRIKVENITSNRQPNNIRVPKQKNEIEK